MKQPKVSVVVPIYNVEPYLVMCLESLLNQTLKEIEIILVDDGSPDNCPQICDEYAQRDSRIKVIHKKNAGLGMARNSGIEIATGKYIAFLDSDDYVDSNMYEILYNKIETSHSELVFCNNRKNLGHNKFIDIIEFDKERCFEGNDIMDLCLGTIASPPGVKKERLISFCSWKAIYINEIIQNKNIRFVSEREYASEDLPFLLLYFKECKKIVFIPDVLYTYTVNNVNSLTKQVKWSKVEATINLYHLLNNLMGDTWITRERTNRFLIGYLREFSYLECEINTNISDKIAFLKRINSIKEWKEIGVYKCFDLPFYNAIIYILQKNKLTYLSLCALYFFKELRKLNKAI